MLNKVSKVFNLVPFVNPVTIVLSWYITKYEFCHIAGLQGGGALWQDRFSYHP